MVDIIIGEPVVEVTVEGVAPAVIVDGFSPGIVAQKRHSGPQSLLERQLEGLVMRIVRGRDVADSAEIRIQPAALDVLKVMRGKWISIDVGSRYVDRGIQFP